MNDLAQFADDLGKVLPRLDDEILFAILDVTLDIENEMLVGSNPIYIPIRRVYVRYEILFPANTVSGTDRYCELRWKAGLFLQKYGVVEMFEYREQGGHRWNGLIEVTVSDPTRFPTLLTQLRI